MLDFVLFWAVPSFMGNSKWDSAKLNRASVVQCRTLPVICLPARYEPDPGTRNLTGRFVKSICPASPNNLLLPKRATHSTLPMR